ncbi:MAG: nucleotidyltransferase domain-containing protein [Pseudomonadota bacterium]
MVQSIVATVDPELIVLFGSRARGEADEDSDVDLPVVQSEPFHKDRSRRKELERLAHAPARFRLPKDVLLYSHDEMECRRDSLNNVAARALREGRVVYERPQASQSNAWNGQQGPESPRRHEESRIL